MSKGGLGWFMKHIRISCNNGQTHERYKDECGAENLGFDPTCPLGHDVLGNGELDWTPVGLPAYLLTSPRQKVWVGTAPSLGLLGGALSRGPAWSRRDSSLPKQVVRLQPIYQPPITCSIPAATHVLPSLLSLIAGSLSNLSFLYICPSLPPRLPSCAITLRTNPFPRCLT